MGLLHPDFEVEARLIHFCIHRVIKSRVHPHTDVVAGMWFVKTPREFGTQVPVHVLPFRHPASVSIPVKLFDYLDEHLGPGGYWEGW